MYIISNDMLSKDSNNEYFLRLNREQSILEVYKKCESSKLRDEYPIRKEFDESGYTMFELYKEMKCIFGGEGKKRTPSGLFHIYDKSKGEYRSSYYKGKDCVKFFGYLSFFEDYFIHSDLYDENITIKNYKEAEPISKNDEHTAGCIRVEQEDLDWLVENVEVGTVVEMLEDENTITNRDLLLYLICQYSKDGEYKDGKYTKMYSEKRKIAEKYDKSIQEGEKVFNRLNTKRENNTKKFFDKWKHNKNEIIEYIVGKNCDGKSSIESGLEAVLDSKEYNQAYHWIISYYLYTIVDLYGVSNDAISKFLEREITPWKPKGRPLQDPLMCLGLVEIVACDVPENIKIFIENLQQANKEDDDKLLNLIDDDLWKAVCERINASKNSP